MSNGIPPKGLSPKSLHPNTEAMDLKNEIEDSLYKKPQEGITSIVIDPNDVQGKVEEKKERKFNQPLVFDIETYKDTNLKPEYLEGIVKDKVKNYTTPKTIEKHTETARNKFALDSRTGRIIMIGFHMGVDGFMQFGKNNESEAKILRNAWEYMNTKLSEGRILVSFGGKRFDLPFMLKRSILNKLEIPLRFSYSQLIHRYTFYPHTDLEKVVEDGGLAEWSYLIGESTTWENDGHLIAKYYEEQNMDWIAQKNLTDMDNTLELYRRFEKWL